jgi:hypothetical protein
MRLGDLKIGDDIGIPVKYDDVVLTYSGDLVTKVELFYLLAPVKTVNLTYTGDKVTEVEIYYNEFDITENLTLSYTGDKVIGITKAETV